MNTARASALTNQGIENAPDLEKPSCTIDVTHLHIAPTGRKHNVQKALTDAGPSNPQEPVRDKSIGGAASHAGQDVIDSEELTAEDKLVMAAFMRPYRRRRPNVPRSQLQEPAIARHGSLQAELNFLQTTREMSEISLTAAPGPSDPIPSQNSNGKRRAADPLETIETLQERDAHDAKIRERINRRLEAAERDMAEAKRYIESLDERGEERKAQMYAAFQQMSDEEKFALVMKSKLDKKDDDE